MRVRTRSENAVPARGGSGVVVMCVILGAEHVAAARADRVFELDWTVTALLKPSRWAPSVAKKARSVACVRARSRPWKVLPSRSRAVATVVHEPLRLRRWIATDWPSSAGANVPLKRTLDLPALSARSLILGATETCTERSLGVPCELVRYCSVCPGCSLKL